ncbi:uncharacterized protein LOC121861437 [Homarus americanus]|uniref:Uncharacterized protein n=1 Tax=Homarus americanus TaxID=6706 RepID=A0A8J5TID1_HOMAM|nr:uncharacterized protein LOC121861437 [Homarus americanus]KAG7172653.1 hypothetical protein Hamer_G006870 [Homarus americanus]
MPPEVQQEIASLKENMSLIQTKISLVTQELVECMNNATILDRAITLTNTLRDLVLRLKEVFVRLQQYQTLPQRSRYNDACGSIERSLLQRSLSGMAEVECGMRSEKVVEALEEMMRAAREMASDPTQHQLQDNTICATRHLVNTFTALIRGSEVLSREESATLDQLLQQLTTAKMDQIHRAISDSKHANDIWETTLTAELEALAHVKEDLNEKIQDVQNRQQQEHQDNNET